MPSPYPDHIRQILGDWLASLAADKAVEPAFHVELVTLVETGKIGDPIGFAAKKRTEHQLDAQQERDQRERHVLRRYVMPHVPF